MFHITIWNKGIKVQKQHLAGTIFAHASPNFMTIDSVAEIYLSQLPVGWSQTTIDNVFMLLIFTIQNLINPTWSLQKSVSEGQTNKTNNLCQRKHSTAGRNSGLKYQDQSHLQAWWRTQAICWSGKTVVLHTTSVVGVLTFPTSHHQFCKHWRAGQTWDYFGFNNYETCKPTDLKTPSSCSL